MKMRETKTRLLIMLGLDGPLQSGYYYLSMNDDLVEEHNKFYNGIRHATLFNQFYYMRELMINASRRHLYGVKGVRKNHATTSGKARRASQFRRNF